PRTRTTQSRTTTRRRPLTRRHATRARLPAMDRDFERLLAEALKLPPEARAALAGSLIDSLDTDVDPGAEAAWAAEIARPIPELAEGRAKGSPWEEARRIIRGG